MKNCLIIIMAVMPVYLMSCGGNGNNDDYVEPDPVIKPETEIVDIVSVWKESTNNKESVVSFAKDGTYKMMLKDNYSIYYFISTGRYTLGEGQIVCKDNCVDDASKTYSYSINNDGDLILGGKKFKKSGVEENALENKISGTSHIYNGYTISKDFKTIGECNFIMQFTNDYRSIKTKETVYWDGVSKGSTEKKQFHYIYYDGDLFLAEENSSVSPKYFFEILNSNYTEIYYFDESGERRIP